jgi:hypothetical protein
VTIHDRAFDLMPTVPMLSVLIEWLISTFRAARGDYKEAVGHVDFLFFLFFFGDNNMSDIHVMCECDEINTMCVCVSLHLFLHITFYLSSQPSRKQNKIVKQTLLDIICILKTKKGQEIEDLVKKSKRWKKAKATHGNAYAEGKILEVYVVGWRLSFFFLMPCHVSMAVWSMHSAGLNAYKANTAKPTRPARAAPLAITALPTAAELSLSIAASAESSLLSLPEDDDGEEVEEVAEAVLELVDELDASGSAVVNPPFLRPLPSAGEISRPLILPPLVA